MLVRLGVEILAADRAETGAVIATDDLVGQLERNRVTRPGAELQLVVDHVVGAELVAGGGIETVELARTHVAVDLGMCKAAHAKAVDSAMFPGGQGGPLMHVIAAKAVCFGECLKPEFKTYSEQIVKNARALAAAMTSRGYKIVSGGTDNHLMLVDLRSKGLTGKVAEQALDRAGITVNKNTVPRETQSPFVTSGIRIGTPAVTTRGLKEDDMREIASLIDRILSAPEDAGVAASVSNEVREMMSRFPLYPNSFGARGSEIGA